MVVSTSEDISFSPPPSATAVKKVPKKSPHIVRISAVKAFNLQKYLANCRVYLITCSIV
jgi:hypothetical protein